MTKEETTTPVSPVARTSSGLRDAIFDEIDAIRDGRSNPTRANAVAKLATGVVETVRMEMEVQRHLKNVAMGAVSPGNSSQGSGLFGGKPLSLGSQ